MQVLMHYNLHEYIGQEEVDDIIETANGIVGAAKLDVSYIGSGRWQAIVFDADGNTMANKWLIEKPGAAGGWNNIPQALRKWNFR